ncbi:leucine-rich repeat-containing protein 41 [Colossoma macropomum]|uniref:leucine-rich repeat-containing protein 41 n=1 Tax=Colossoma macropomum TaxID=42526 RepID=UPI00186559A7|nr:leucine-rich repeat-containing protein 41 [Colossoma macropomum]
MWAQLALSSSMATTTLVSMCIRTVAQNMDVLEERVCDLPASLLKDLLPHLNMFYLDRIEKVALLKRVSTSLQVAWAAKWRDLNRTWRCKLKFMQPEENWKQKCLESLFHMVLFRKTQVHNILSNLSEYAVLTMSAEHVRVLSLTVAGQGGCRLASEELRPILSILEKRVRCLRLFDAMALLKQGRKDILFVLHRLLDHGSVTEVVLKRTPDCFLFSWITSRCRRPPRIDSQASAAPDTWDTCRNEDLWTEEGPSAPKCPRLDLCMDEKSCCKFSPSCSVSGQCHVGKIHSLDLEVRSLATVSRLLPSWLCLHSLHLYGTQPLWKDDVADFVVSLKKLFLNPCCSLRELSMGNVCSRNLLAGLLAACPMLPSLSLDINLPQDNRTTPGQNLQFKQDTELSLEKLSLKSTEIQTVENFPSVLQRAPKLSNLHVTGIRHAHLLLHTLPESNPLLKVLILEDINLADCHQEIINLMENSILEELSLKDCRLLEKCREKKDFLVPFVVAVRGLCSLHSLSLCQNRLATSVIEIADLFFGDCPSKITKLDLSSNFILPADLLEFAQRIEKYHPAQRLTLDLRFNPLDRDPKAKGQAMKKLLPFCNILTDDWDSRSTMADHVSVM